MFDNLFKTKYKTENINRILKSECKKFLNIGDIITTIIVSIGGEATLHFKHLHIIQLLLIACFMLNYVIIYSTAIVNWLYIPLLILFFMFRVKFNT